MLAEIVDNHPRLRGKKSGDISGLAIAASTAVQILARHACPTYCIKLANSLIRAWRNSQIESQHKFAKKEFKGGRNILGQNSRTQNTLKIFSMHKQERQKGKENVKSLPQLQINRASGYHGAATAGIGSGRLLIQRHEEMHSLKGRNTA